MKYAIQLKETNMSKAYMIEAFFSLIEKYAFEDLTIARIADKANIGRRTFYRYFKNKDEVVEYIGKLVMYQFGEMLLKNKAKTAEEIAVCYFAFWEEYIDILLLLKKANLLHFIGDHLEELMMDVAIQTNHLPDELIKDEKAREKLMNHYHYQFSFKLAGFWQVTKIWCSEVPRKTPQEMCELLMEFLKG